MTPGVQHPHAEFLDRIYRRDPDSFDGLIRRALDADFRCHGAGSGDTVGGEFLGLRQMVEHVNELEERSGGTLSATPLYIYADDNWAMVPQVMTAARGDKQLSMSVAGIWRFSGPERLAEHWELVDDIVEYDSFWA